jgi:hypothetical protein
MKEHGLEKCIIVLWVWGYRISGDSDRYSRRVILPVLLLNHHYLSSPLSHPPSSAFLRLPIMKKKVNIHPQTSFLNSQEITSLPGSPYGCLRQWQNLHAIIDLVSLEQLLSHSFL